MANNLYDLFPTLRDSEFSDFAKSKRFENAIIQIIISGIRQGYDMKDKDAFSRWVANTSWEVYPKSGEQIIYEDEAWKHLKAAAIDLICVIPFVKGFKGTFKSGARVANTKGLAKAAQEFKRLEEIAIKAEKKATELGEKMAQLTEELNKIKKGVQSRRKTRLQKDQGNLGRELGDARKSSLNADHDLARHMDNTTYLEKCSQYKQLIEELKGAFGNANPVTFARENINQIIRVSENMLQEFLITSQSIGLSLPGTAGFMARLARGDSFWNAFDASLKADVELLKMIWNATGAGSDGFDIITWQSKGLPCEEWANRISLILGFVPVVGSIYSAINLVVNLGYFYNASFRIGLHEWDRFVKDREARPIVSDLIKKDIPKLDMNQLFQVININQ